MPDKNTKLKNWTMVMLLSGCGTIFALSATEIFAFFMDNSFLWKVIAWIVFVGGLSLSAYRAKKFSAERTEDEKIFGVQLGGSLLGGFSAVIIYLFSIIRNNFILYGELISASVFFILFSLGIIFVNGILFGKLLIGQNKKRALSSQVVVLCQGLGFLLGATIFHFSFIFSLNEMALALMAGIINTLVIFTGFRREKKFRAKFNSMIFILVLLIFSLQASRGWEQYFLKKYYYYQEIGKSLKSVFSSTAGYPEIKRERTKRKTIDLVKIKNSSISDWLIKAYSRKLQEYPDFPQDYEVFINGRRYYSTNFSDILGDYLVHLPVILNGKIPEKVLVIGDFSGAVASELEKYPKIKEIVFLGLGKKEYEFAKNNDILRKVNKDSLVDKRIRLVTQDALDFLRQTEEKFDAVFLSIPQNSDPEFSRFFSREFFSNLLERMDVNGFCAAILADGGDSIMSVKAALEEAGARSIKPYQSNLEKDNTNVFSMLNEMLEKGMIIKGKSPERISDKTQAMQDILRENIGELRKNFMYFRKIPVKIKYHEYGINYTLLDEGRFYSAFIIEASETSQKTFLKLKFPKAKL